MSTFGGAVSANTSNAMMVNLTAFQGNDTSWQMQIMQGQFPQSLTTDTVKVVVKASSVATDASGTTYTISPAIVINNAALGMLTFTLPHSASGTAGTLWWRLDVTDGSGNVGTALYGNLYIQAV